MLRKRPPSRKNRGEACQNFRKTYHFVTFCIIYLFIAFVVFPTFGQGAHLHTNVLNDLPGSVTFASWPATCRSNSRSYRLVFSTTATTAPSGVLKASTGSASLAGFRNVDPG